MFKRSVLTLLSLVVAFNCFQQAYAVTPVQPQHNSSHYETVKKATIKYGSIAADTTSTLWLTMVGLAGLMAMNFSGCITLAAVTVPLCATIGGYGVKNLYKAYKNHDNADQQLSKRSYKAACGNALVAACGLVGAAVARRTMLNLKKSTNTKRLFCSALILGGLRAAYSASCAAYRNLTAKPQSNETKKV